MRIKLAWEMFRMYVCVCERERERGTESCFEAACILTEIALLVLVFLLLTSHVRHAGGRRLSVHYESMVSEHTLANERMQSGRRHPPPNTGAFASNVCAHICAFYARNMCV